MKLLVVTQVVDLEHPVLGFFHYWIEALAERCEHISVICLEKGTCALPSNVTVYSLGKEESVSRLVYLRRFFTYVWQLRHSYTHVFVHMNQEYVLLAGWLWRLLKKPVVMWRNHYAGSWLTAIAVMFCTRVFYTSGNSYTARFKNAVAMPIGINMRLFTATDAARPERSLLYVGRIATSKRIMAVLEAMVILKEKGETYRLTVAGPATSTADQKYEAALLAYAKQKGLAVTFVGAVVYKELPALFSNHEVCINMSPPGMFDKVIGEAISCGAVVVTTNKDAAKAPGVYSIDTHGNLAVLLADTLEKGVTTDLVAAREYVTQKHSLQNLTEKILVNVER